MQVGEAGRRSAELLLGRGPSIPTGTTRGRREGHFSRGSEDVSENGKWFPSKPVHPFRQLVLAEDTGSSHLCCPEQLGSYSSQGPRWGGAESGSGRLSNSISAGRKHSCDPGPASTPALHGNPRARRLQLNLQMTSMQAGMASQNWSHFLSQHQDQNH